MLYRDSNNEQVVENIGYLNYDAYKNDYDTDVAQANATLAQAMVDISYLSANSYYTNKITYEFFVTRD